MKVNTLLPLGTPAPGLCDRMQTVRARPTFRNSTPVYRKDAERGRLRELIQSLYSAS